MSLIASHPIPVCHRGCVLESPQQRDTEQGRDLGQGKQPPGTAHGSGVLGSLAQPGNPPLVVLGTESREVPGAMPPSPPRFLLSPDALTPPLHGDGEAPAGTGQPGPHPTPVTPAHGGGIGFLQPHLARPPPRGDGGGTETGLPLSPTSGDRDGLLGNRWAGAMASQLEGAMETLINVFHHYSGKEGDKYKLSKKELKELLQSELGCFLETQKDTGAVEKIMQDLDENGDGEVDFQEYVVLVAALTVACNTFFWENA
ncbi:protein S100-A1 isoform 2-T2 [Ciconia maguari]